MRRIRVPKNLTRLAYEEMRSYILDGSVGNGDRLTEEFVSRRLGISKSPVREAFNRLEAEGLIRIEPRKGAYVRFFSPQEVFELYDLREALEVHAVARAQLTPKILKKLENRVELLDQYFADNDKIAYLKLDTEFHALIAFSTGNIKLTETLENLQMQFVLLGRRTFEFSTSKAIPTHRMLVSALKIGSREKAQELMRNHIQNTREELLRQMAASETTAV